MGASDSTAILNAVKLYGSSVSKVTRRVARNHLLPLSLVKYVNVCICELRACGKVSVLHVPMYASDRGSTTPRCTCMTVGRRCEGVTGKPIVLLCGLQQPYPQASSSSHPSNYAIRQCESTMMMSSHGKPEHRLRQSNTVMARALTNHGRRCSGVATPRVHGVSTCRSRDATSTCPTCVATISAVCPKEFFWFTAEPPSSNHIAASTCPFSAASIRAVAPVRLA